MHDSTTFYTFAPMKRKIRTYGGYFEAFMETLKEKEQEKVQYGILLLKITGQTAQEIREAYT